MISKKGVHLSLANRRRRFAYSIIIINLVKENLGNVRISYKNINNTAEITDLNDFYPFGMNIPDLTVYKFAASGTGWGY